jgi:hypothetical protein
MLEPGFPELWEALARPLRKAAPMLLTPSRSSLFQN